MPFYSYRCDPCGLNKSERRSVAERYDTPLCARCGVETRLVVTGTHLAPVTRAGTGSSGLTKRAKSHISQQY